MNQAMTFLSPEQIDRLARKRASAKMGWYTHAAVYVVVNAFLVLLAQASLGHRAWSIYPVLGWGVGLGLHGLAVFFFGGGSDLRQRLVERERQQLLREQERSAPW